MKYFCVCMSIFLCSVTYAGSSDIIREVEDLEFLFSHIDPGQPRVVTHQYRNGIRLHDYYLACMVEEDNIRYVGLTSFTWSKCYIRQGSKLEVKTIFSFWIKNDQELQKKAESIIRASSKINSRGVWKADHDVYVKDAPCLQFTLITGQSKKEFCLHSEAVAATDFAMGMLYLCLCILSSLTMTALPLLFSL